MYFSEEDSQWKAPKLKAGRLALGQQKGTLNSFIAFIFLPEFGHAVFNIYFYLLTSMVVSVLKCPFLT